MRCLIAMRSESAHCDQTAHAFQNAMRSESAQISFMKFHNQYQGNHIRETISLSFIAYQGIHIRETRETISGKPIDDKMHATNWLVTQTTETIALHSETKYESIEKRRQKIKYTSFLTTNTSLLIKLGMLQHYPIAYSSALRHDDLHKVFKLAPWLCQSGQAHRTSA